MAFSDQDKNFITEDTSLDFSIDDILADYYTDRAASAVRPVMPDAEDDDVRVYVPGSAKKASKPQKTDAKDTFAAAFSALEQHSAEDYAAYAAEFAAYDYSADYSRQDTASHGYSAEQSRDSYSRYSVSQPSEEEIRSYLASLTEEDIERMSAESEVYETRYKNAAREPEEPEIDSRFNIGRDVFKNNSSIRYGEQELDLSAEPDYEPAAQ